MATSYLTPGLYFEFVDSGGETIRSIRTDIAAFIGVAAKGVLDHPVAVRSFAQFQSRFGAFLNGPFLAYAVRAFFENGGRECRIVRVAAPPHTTMADLGGPQPADRSFSTLLSVEGFAPGAVVSIRQNPAFADDVLLADVDTATGKLTWAHPLKPEYIPGVAAEFATGAASAEGVLLDFAGQPTVRITAESPGAWGNNLAVLTMQSNPAATQTRGSIAQPADRMSSYVDSLAGFEPGALVKVYQAVPAPLAAWHVVEKLDPDAHRLLWTIPLELGFDLTQPIGFETREFSLSVYESGELREIFAGLSLRPEHARYITKAIGPDTSRFIRVEDLLSITPWPDRLPNPSAPNLKFGRLYLRSGRDGTAALRTIDFTGDPLADEKRGLRSLEDEIGVSAVAIPDLLMQPTPPVETTPPEKPVDP